MNWFVWLGLVALALFVASALAVLWRKETRLDANVQFSVYRPSKILPDQWYRMLAFAHLSERAPDPKRRQIDPVADVLRQVAHLLGGAAETYQGTTQDASRSVPLSGQLRFEPVVRGLEFNPAWRSFRWYGPVHKEEFEFRSTGAADGVVRRGELRVYLGGLLIAEINLAITVSKDAAPPEVTPHEESDRAKRYRKIFPSYSRRDSDIVADVERSVRTLGDRYLKDVRAIRAGEIWNKRIPELIEEADVFQLFWSWNSMDSDFVRQEWEHALSLRRPNFLRPVYWEEPLPSRPEEGLPPESLSRLHFHRLLPLGRPRFVLLNGRRWLRGAAVVVFVATLAWVGSGLPHERIGEDLLASPRVFEGAFVWQGPSALSFRIDGRLDTLEVALGDEIRMGQVVARLDPTEYEMKQRKAAADLAAAEAVLRHAEANLERAKANGASDLEAARATLQRAIAQRAEAASASVQADWQLALTVLRAPTDGTVTSVHVEPGSRLQSGQRILDVSSEAEVRAYVPRALARQIGLGQTAMVYLDSQPELYLDGVVTMIGEGSDSDPDGAVALRIQVADAKPRFLIERALVTFPSTAHPP